METNANNLHSKLKQQIQRHLGTEVDPNTPLGGLLQEINASYQDHEADSNSAEEEQALKQSFVEASAMLDAVPESFFHIDDTDRIAAFKLSEDFCELGRKELTSGQDLLMSFPPRVNAQLRILFEQCRASKEVQTSEIPLNDILQKKYLYKVRALPLENNHLMLVLKDVTEAGQQRQHIEHTSEQILQQNALLQQLFDLASGQQHTQNLLDTLVKDLCGFLQAERTAIWLYRDQQKYLERRRQYCSKTQSFTRTLSLPTNGLRDYLAQLEQEQVLAFRDIKNNPFSQRLLSDELYKKDDVSAAIDVLIVENNKPAGVLSVDFSTQPKEWTSLDYSFLKTLAAQIPLFLDKKHSDQGKLATKAKYKTDYTALSSATTAALFAYTDNFVFINRAMRQLCGFELIQLKQFGIGLFLGDTFNSSFPSTPPSDKLVASYRSNGPDCLSQFNIPKELEAEISPANGHSRWLSISVAPINLEGENIWLATAFDITERKLTESKLRYDAYHDELTGLANRAHLIDKLEKCLEKRSRDRYYRFAVINIKIKQNKNLSDKLSVSDEAFLLEASLRLREIARNGDILARISNSEFSFLMLNIGHFDEVMGFVKRCQKLLAKPLCVDNLDAESINNIGVAYSDRRYEKAEDALRDADIAMYRARDAGNNTVEVFDTEMQAKTQKLKEVETALHSAVNKEQLHLLYQPIVDLKSGELSAFEALLRWNSQQNAYRSPEDFIPIAERSGDIIPLGNWTIKNAFKQLQNWRSENGDIKICINLSVTQLEKSGLQATLKTLIHENAIPAENLQLDIRETALLQGNENINQTIRELGKSGYEICLDDYGTGMSSINHLLQFQLKTIKIHETLIQKITPDNNDTNNKMVRSLISLAHSLGLKVVAEGVENTEQLHYLCSQGCDFAQGYLFSKPISDSLATKLVGRAWNLETGVIRRDAKGKRHQFFG